MKLNRFGGLAAVAVLTQVVFWEPQVLVQGGWRPARPRYTIGDVLTAQQLDEVFGEEAGSRASARGSQVGSARVTDIRTSSGDQGSVGGGAQGGPQPRGGEGRDRRAGGTGGGTGGGPSPHDRGDRGGDDGGDSRSGGSGGADGGSGAGTGGSYPV